MGGKTEGGRDEVRNVEGWKCCGVKVRIMTVDKSRGVERQAVSSSTNRIKKDGIPPGGLDTLTPESDGRSDISASPCNTPAGLGLTVCACVLYSSEDGDIRTKPSSQG